MNYDACPLQPVLQGLVTFAGGVPSFYGQGVSAVAVVPVVGAIRLTLDAGLPGDVALDTDFARTRVSVRDSIAGRTVTTRVIDYPDATHVDVLLLAVAAPVSTDFEIVVERGDAGVDPNAAGVQIIGGTPNVIIP